LRNRKGSAGVLLTSVATTKHWRAARRVRPGERSGLQGLGAVRLSVKQARRVRSCHAFTVMGGGRVTRVNTRKLPQGEGPGHNRCVQPRAGSSTQTLPDAAKTRAAWVGRTAPSGLHAEARADPPWACPGRLCRSSRCQCSRPPRTCTTPARRRQLRSIGDLAAPRLRHARACPLAPAGKQRGYRDGVRVRP